MTTLDTARLGARVLVVGDIVTDVLAVHNGSLAIGSDTQARISITGGGSAANTAAWLASLDCPVDLVVDLVGVAGTDVAGDDRVAELTAAGVGCAWVRRSPDAPTGTVIVLAHAAERSMLCDRGANHLLLPSDVDSALSGDAKHLHLSGYTLLDGTSRAAGLHALAAAAGAGLTTSVDAASAAPLRRLGGSAFLDLVRGTDILFANLDEAQALLDAPPADLAPPLSPPPDPAPGLATPADPAPGRAPADLARALAKVVRHAVVKLGPDGAIWADSTGALVEVAAVPATVVDPTGAGDAFAAGLLSAWLTGSPPAAALAQAAQTGAQAVSLLSGRPHPTPPQLVDLGLGRVSGSPTTRLRPRSTRNGAGRGRTARKEESSHGSGPAKQDSAI